MNTSPTSNKRSETFAPGLVGGVSFLIGTSIGLVFFFGPTIGLYAPVVSSHGAPTNKGAKK